MQNLIENKSYSKLDFYTGLGLLTVDQANHSDVTYLERIHLNQAEKYGAYAVYFRRIDDRSIPQAYIYNYSQQQFDAEKEIAELQWELWNANLVPIIYIFSDNKIKIINCLKKPELDINKKPKLFDDLILAQKIDDELKDRFSALRFDEGTFWDYGDNKDILLKSESSYDLLIENIKTIRNEIRNISENQDERNLFDKLLILSLLIKYLEERTESNGESIISEYLQNADYYTDFLNEAEPKELLVFFDKLSKKFNGDAFELSNFEKQLLNDIDSQCLLSFSRIFIKNEDKGQYYLWDLYSFKHLPVELISSIYEIFLKDNGTDKKGAVYTPNILVDLMLDESLPLNQETIENVDPLNYKILDPACGSGIFLVKAFKRLVNIWKIKNNTWIIDNNTLNTILTNIYGVDKEGICLELSAFSLNLAVCDFMKPSEIEKIKFTKLKGIKLIGKDVDNEEKEGFFWSILNDKIPKDFDLVIGNPPFTGQKKEWTISANQIEKLENIKIPNDKLELLFLQQSFKVCKSKGKVSLLCYAPSFLYNFGSKPFRKKLFKDYEIYKLFDFTALRKDLFKDKKPPILLINGINIKPDLDFIEFISIKRTFSSKKKMLFEIDYYDRQKIRYSDAIQKEHVWKSNLLYGNRLFLIGEKLASLPSLGDFIKNRKEDGWLFNTGIVVGDDKKRKMLNSNKDKKRLNAKQRIEDYYYTPGIEDKYYLAPQNLTTHGITGKSGPLKYPFLSGARLSVKRMFEGPTVLINTKFENEKLIIRLLENPGYFSKGISGIYAPQKHIGELIKIENILKKYNKIFHFYILFTSSRHGIYRANSFNHSDLKNLPFTFEFDNIFTDIDEIIIDDVIKYFYPLLNSTEKSNKILFSKIKPDCSIINDFQKVFLKGINSIYEDFHKCDPIFTKSKSMIICPFYYGNEPEIDLSELKSVEMDRILNELVNDDEKGPVRNIRILRLYKKNMIFLIKPNQKRYWLKSIAIRDADDTVYDMFEMGY